MAEYIDKDKLQQALHEAHLITLSGQMLIHNFPAEDVVLVRKVDETEYYTLDVARVVHGSWRKIALCEYQCSECGKIVFADDSNELNYCSNCGAKMDA